MIKFILIKHIILKIFKLYFIYLNLLIKTYNFINIKDLIIN